MQVGQPVQRGELIAEPAGFVSVALHAPASGRVEAIELRLHPNGQMLPAIVIAADPFASQRLAPSPAVDPAALTRDDFLERVQRGGIVGLGTHDELLAQNGAYSRLYQTQFGEQD